MAATLGKPQHQIGARIPQESINALMALKNKLPEEHNGYTPIEMKFIIKKNRKRFKRESHATTGSVGA